MHARMRQRPQDCLYTLWNVQWQNLGSISNLTTFSLLRNPVTSPDFGLPNWKVLMDLSWLASVSLYVYRLSELLSHLFARTFDRIAFQADFFTSRPNSIYVSNRTSIVDSTWFKRTNIYIMQNKRVLSRYSFQIFLIVICNWSIQTFDFRKPP